MDTSVPSAGQIYHILHESTATYIFFFLQKNVIMIIHTFYILQFNLITNSTFVGSIEVSLFSLIQRVLPCINAKVKMRLKPKSRKPPSFSTCLVRSAPRATTTHRTWTSTGSCATRAPWSPSTWSSPTCCRGSGCRRCCLWTTAWRRWPVATAVRLQEPDPWAHTGVSCSRRSSDLQHAGGDGRAGEHLHHLHLRPRLPHRTVWPRQRWDVGTRLSCCFEENPSWRWCCGLQRLRWVLLLPLQGKHENLNGSVRTFLPREWSSDVFSWS